MADEGKIENGTKVRVHYKGTLTDGTVFDSSEGRDPLEFEVGGGQVIPGFEAAIVAMQPGEAQTITIPMAEAYGPRDEDLLRNFPRDMVPEDMPVEAGMTLQVQDENGQAFPVRVADVSDEQITLDGNHPMAGHDLTFALQLVEIL
jgi:FKBP-type peptidyl-prolyl cis-trans isomerase 2